MTSTSTALRVLRAVAAVGVVAVLLTVVLPGLTGAAWTDSLRAVEGVAPRWLALLGLIWAVGLGLNALTLTAGLPGLRYRRALLLSLTGSAVANVLPLGGAAGIALNRHMTRVWGHDATAFAAYTAVTNVWDVAAKLLLAAVTVPLLLLLGAGGVLPAALRPVLEVAAALSALGIVGLGGLSRARAGGRLAGHRLGRAVLEVRSACAGVVALGWRRLTCGTVSYNVALALLLWSCAHVTGLPLSLPQLALAFAVERLLTLAGLTPGGAGVVEVGLAAVLVTGGGAPATVLTTVLLYRLFTYGIEIPIGGAGLLAWLILRRLARRRAALAGAGW